MGIRTFDYTSKTFLNIATGCCKSVYVCLTPEAAAKTIDGRALQLVTIENTGRFLGNKGRKRLVEFENPRCIELYQYLVAYDDVIMQQGYLLGCDDINEVIPYDCLITNILDLIDTLPDWVVDSANVVQTVDPTTNQFDVYIPIIDRVNNVLIGSFTLDLSALFDDTATDIDAYAAGGHAVTLAAILGGGTEQIQILSQDADNILYAGSDNGNYLTCSDVLDCINVDKSAISGDGSALDPFSVIFPAETPNAAIDTDTVDLTLTGGLSRTIQADVKVSGDTNQAITVETDGLFVDKSSSGIESLAETGDAGALDISSAGTYTIATSAVLTVTNPSAVNPLNVLLTSATNVQCTFQDLGVWKLIIEQSLDGGGFTVFAESQWGAFPGTTGLPMTTIANHDDTVPAGGTLTIQRRVKIQTVTPSNAGSTAGVYSMDMRALWVTD